MRIRYNGSRPQEAWPSLSAYARHLYRKWGDFAIFRPEFPF